MANDWLTTALEPTAREPDADPRRGSARTLGLKINMSDLTFRKARPFLLTWCAYVAFVFITDWSDYGLIKKPDGNATWIVTRLIPVSLWLLGAFLLLHYRRRPLNWESLLYAFFAVATVGFLIQYTFSGADRNAWAVSGTVAFYALVSGFLCATVGRPLVAAAVGILVFVSQLLVDATAHMVSGLFRLH